MYDGDFIFDYYDNRYLEVNNKRFYSTQEIYDLVKDFKALQFAVTIWFLGVDKKFGQNNFVEANITPHKFLNISNDVIYVEEEEQKNIPIISPISNLRNVAQNNNIGTKNICNNNNNNNSNNNNNKNYEVKDEKEKYEYDINRLYKFINNIRDDNQRMYDRFEDDIDRLFCSIKKIRLDIQSNLDLINKNNDLNNKPSKQTDPQATQLLDWFTNCLKLPQYYNIIVQNGFDSIESLQLITIENLELLGIKKIGHQKQIMHKIKNNKI